MGGRSQKTNMFLKSKMSAKLTIGGIQCGWRQSVNLSANVNKRKVGAKMMKGLGEDDARKWGTICVLRDWQN